MSSAPRRSAPVWAAPYPTEPISGVLTLHTPTDRRLDVPSGSGRTCGDPEAVLARAALRKTRIGRRRAAPRPPRATAHDPRELDRWEDEGGPPRRHTAGNGPSIVRMPVRAPVWPTTGV